MKTLAALGIVVAGAVAAFAVYSFGGDESGPRTSRHVSTLAQGDVVQVPDAAARCVVSAEGGVPNLFCTHTGRTGYQVVLWKDGADLYDLARPVQEMLPTYTAQGVRSGTRPRLRRPPTPSERGQIERWTRWSWRHDQAFSAARRGRSPGIGQILVSELDPHFARVEIRPLDRHGRQVLETATVALMRAGGRWSLVLGPATDVLPVCKSSSPRPLVELFC